MDGREVRDGVLQILKALGVILLFCMAAVLLFAFIVKTAALEANVISPVNRIIKAAAVFLGSMLFVKDNGGWWKGAIIGFFAVLSTKLLFSCIAWEFCWDWTILPELLFGALVGLISGVIAVNIHR